MKSGDATHGSAEIDETLLREFYLPHFQALIQEGQAYSIMAAYNAINGRALLLQQIAAYRYIAQRVGFSGLCCLRLRRRVRDIFSGHHYSASMKEAAALAINAGLWIWIAAMNIAAICSLPYRMVW